MMRHTWPPAPSSDPPAPLDVTSLSIPQVTGSTATIGWTTTTGMVGQVEYGTTSNYGLFTLLKVFPPSIDWVR